MGLTVREDTFPLFAPSRSRRIPVTGATVTAQNGGSRLAIFALRRRRT